MFGITVDVYAMVGIHVNLGYLQLDNRRMDKRHSAYTQPVATFWPTHPTHNIPPPTHAPHCTCWSSIQVPITCPAALWHNTLIRAVHKYVFYFTYNYVKGMLPWNNPGFTFCEQGSCTKFYFTGRDYKHSLEMQKLLKNEIGSIDVFLILFSGAEPR